jgi:predicted phosphodiesterase
LAVNKSKAAWGFGPAPLLRPATKEDTETLVSLSDLHVPYHNEDLVDSAIRLIRKLKPHNVVLNGDIADFFELSRFCQDRNRDEEVQADIDVANTIRERVRKAAPDARLIENEGNHDNRIHSYLMGKAPALRSIRELERSRLFKYKDNEIQWFPGAGFRIRPHFLVKHGTMVRGEAGASAKAEQAASGLSGISGHTHRLAPYRKEGYSRRLWWEQGCLCSLEPDYIVGAPNWTNGIVVAQFSTKSDAFVVEPVEADGDQLVYGGRRI